MIRKLSALLMVFFLGCSNSTSKMGSPENGTTGSSSVIETTMGTTQAGNADLSADLPTASAPSTPSSSNAFDEYTDVPPQDLELTQIFFDPSCESRWRDMACYTNGSDQTGRYLSHLLNASYIDISVEAMVTRRGSGTCAAGYPAMFVTDDNEFIQAIAFMDGFQYGCNGDCMNDISYFHNNTDYSPWTWYRIRVIIDMNSKEQHTWVDDIYLGHVYLPYTGSAIVSYQAAGASHYGHIIFMMRNLEIKISEA